MSKFKHEDDIQGYCILRNEDLDAIHQSTLELMGDYGLQIHGKDAHDILGAAGCDVDRETDRVRFPANLINDAIESCPEEFTLCGRDPKNDTLIGKKRVAYKNFGTGVMGRTSSSEKQMHFPFLVTISTLSVPDVCFIPTSSSSAFRLMAIRPAFRLVSKLDRAVFLMMP